MRLHTLISYLLLRVLGSALSLQYVDTYVVKACISITYITAKFHIAQLLQL